MALLWRTWRIFNRGVSTETSKALLTSFSHSEQNVREGGSEGLNHGCQNRCIRF
jgi:hypothetical protein